MALAPAGAELWLDGGHNPDGGRALAAAMGDLEHQSPRPLVLIAAMLTTKDGAGFLRPFHGLASELLAVPVRHSAAGRKTAELAALAREAGLKAVESSSLEAALERLSERSWPTPPRILLAGSLYFAGDVLEANGTPPQ